MRSLCSGLFITDLDGTLIGSDGTLSQGDIDAIEALSQSGIKTAIATGRSLYSFVNSPGVDIPVDYIIFSTGAGVVSRSGHQLIHRVNIAPEIVAPTLAFLKETELDFMMHYPVPDNHRYIYRRLNSDNNDFESRIERYFEFGRSIDTITGNGFGAACQFLAVVPADKTHAALRQVKAGLPDLSIIRSTSPLDHESTWIELFHPDVSKGKTAAWLASEIGVDQLHTMAVGNDYNDLALLDWAAHSFVVDNAPADMKSRYRQVESNNHGGVAQAIKCWLNERKY